MNRLAEETSPYLQQHADNPVEWYPWGEEALEKARSEDKPILLSVGYAACHWCHVMAHESFEDSETARLMNELFVNVKVDREERPDLDRIYQAAHQLIARRPGGWPLTMFLNPADQVPFFGGTYFPGTARYGMPSFQDVLGRVASFYREQGEQIRDQGPGLVAALRSIDGGDALPGLPDAAALDAHRQQIASVFDRQYGGFQGAPKFPQPTNLERLLRHWRDTASGSEPDVDALFMVSLSLTRMAEGGLYDHLGGGFYRYSVDERWNIPHFEKMLYDNGLLLALYAQAWQATGEELFRRAAAGTADWAMREMRDETGGFFSSLDADSEGEEGRFYAWDRREICELLDDDTWQIFSRRFGLDQRPNFEDGWHLAVAMSEEDIVRELDRTPGEVEAALENARETLFQKRAGRVRPGLDDKILTSWNALMIRGLAIAGRTLQRDDLSEAALAAAAFLHQSLWQDGRLLATWKDGRARFDAYLDDYAFLLDALLEVLQNRWDTGLMNFAIALADDLLDRFRDADGGAFFFTAQDHEHLIHRPRPLGDEALPSGNAVAARALGRLGHLLGETRYLDASDGIMRAGAALMDQHPLGYSALLTAVEEWLSPPETIVIRGAPEAARDWAEAAGALYAPRRLVLAIPDSETDLPGELAARKSGEAETAYVCRGSSCLPPFTELSALAEELAET